MEGAGTITSDTRYKTLTCREAHLQADLAEPLHSWILSSYGPERYEPNLFYDPEVDVSQEEMRWKSVQATKAGNPQAYVSVRLWSGALYSDRSVRSTHVEVVRCSPLRTLKCTLSHIP